MIASNRQLWVGADGASASAAIVSMVHNLPPRLPSRPWRKNNMSKRQHRVVVYLPDVVPSYPAAAIYIERARRDPEQAARNDLMARLHRLGPVLDANPGSIAVKVFESEARLENDPAAIASNVLQRVFFGGAGSRPPPGFGIIPIPRRYRRKAA